MASIPSKVSNLVAQKYQRGVNTFSRLVKSAPERKIETEIGDAKEIDFKPQVKTQWFNNEYNVSVRAEEDPLATVTTEGEKIVYTRSDGIKVVQYDKPDAGEEGGHELEWEIPSMPKFDGDFYRLKFTLRYKGNVKFYYQPALTQEEIDEGASRPENVEGSYAVYVDKSWHRITEIQGQRNYWTERLFEEYPEDIELQARYKNIQTREQVDARKQEILDQIEGFDILIEEDPQSGNNYATGKIEHIYRPKAIDAEGNEAWCTLYIPDQGQAETNIEGWVDVPRSFLEKVDYSKGPAVIDPEFGYTSAGGTVENDQGGNDDLSGCNFGTPSAGTVQKLSFYSVAGSWMFGDDVQRGVIIELSGETIITNGLSPLIVIAQANNSARWRDSTYSTEPTITAQNYALGFVASSGNAASSIYYDSGDSNTSFHEPNVGYNPPDISAGLTFDQNRKYSIYATYTASGGEGGEVASTPMLSLLGVG